MCIKRNKAPGIDRITGEMIQAGGDAVYKILTQSNAENLRHENYTG